MSNLDPITGTIPNPDGAFGQGTQQPTLIDPVTLRLFGGGWQTGTVLTGTTSGPAWLPGGSTPPFVFTQTEITDSTYTINPITDGPVIVIPPTVDYPITINLPTG